MKTKSRHHKEENTFKFLTLAERLSNINVDVVRRINRYNEKPEETETYFYQALARWVELNYTASFHDFVEKIKKRCQTLALIVYHKQTIIDALIEFISKADPLSIQPILDLAVQLSRDLQQDFYPYFPQIFSSITKLLDTQDTNVLEWSFQTLSYLFKFLWRYMLKDLDNVYELYSPLFSETRKEYIRNFAAESFAFLMRKMNDKNQVYEFLFNRLKQHPEELNGIGRLIFEMFKGIKHQFNACTEQCFTMLLDKLNCFAESSESSQLVFECISKTVESMADYTKKQHTSVVWKSFYATIDKFISNKQNEKLVNLMKLISLFLKLKNCNLVDNLDTLIDNLCKIAALEPFDDKESYSKLTECLMDIGEQLMLSETVKFSIEKTNVLPTRLFHPKYDLNLVIKLTKNLFNYNLFEGVILPNLINYFEHHIALNDQKNKNLYEISFIKLISEYLTAYKHIIEVNSGLKLKATNEEVVTEKIEVVSTKKAGKTKKNGLDLANGDDSKAKEEASLNFFDDLVKQKFLTQFMRLFEEKKYLSSKLNAKLVEFINESYMKSKISELNQNQSEDPNRHNLLIELLIATPFLFQQNAKTTGLIYELSDCLIKKISSDFDKYNNEVENTESLINNKLGSNLEINSFLLSLSIWSLILLKNNKQHLAGSKLSVEVIGSLLDNLNKLKMAIKNKNILKYNNVVFDKCENNILRSMNFYLIASISLNSSNEKNKIAREIESVIHLLKNLLSSPYHETRLNALNILSNYFTLTSTNEARKESSTEEKKDDFDSLIEICLKAEQTPASLDEYRQKIYYLQLLDSSVCSKYFNDGEINNKDVPLRYFFGVLYENFKLIWTPVVELIQSYASSMKMNDFWSVFGEQLTGLSDKIESKLYHFKNETSVNEEGQENAETNILTQLAHLRFGNESNIDHLNNRLLMCQSMQGFANSCESKTRLLVPIFFRFMNNEYYTEENRLLSTAYDDLTINRHNAKDRNSSSKDKFFNKSLLNKHLCAYLDIFSKFTSPKSWYQEENLRNLYLNLLCHHDSNVQKSALSCLYTYNYVYLKPYKDHLEKLLDNKHFRHELVVFSLDENNGIIHSDDRAKLLPILMRLLYGKFHSHETTHTSSRDTKTNKRSTIIQFLSSCSEYELNYFFNLIFDCINTIGGINTVKGKNLKIENGIEDRVMVEDEANDRFEINDNSYDSNKKDYLLAKLQLKLNDTKSEASIYNLKRVIPIKKILGILQSLEIIIKKLGRQMENFAHRILQMLGFMYKYTHTINEILSSQKGSNKSYEYHMSLIKIVRQKITLRVKEFFDTFDQLNFTQQEYFFIFDSFIWPQSVKIPAESLKSVSNLLKIFSLWSERSKYYPLFVVKIADFNAIDSNLVASLESCAKNDSSQINIMDYFKTKSLLDVLFELIDNPKCSQAVIDFVLEIVHNLVTFADFKIEDKQDEEMSKGDEITKELPFELEPYKADLKNYSTELNLGTLFLKPYVNSIINHVEKIVIMNMSKKTLPAKPLKILARLSCFATSSKQQCEKIIQLLVPYLIKNRKQAEENELNILNSINHLIRQVGNVEDFIFPLSRLFAVIKNRQSRVELCNVFNTIQEINPKFQFIHQLVNDLNAWDPKRVEEPDYMIRLDAFKRLNQTVNDWTCFDYNLASILMYNCFFFINSVEDLAIKESSTNCVQLFLKKSASLDLKKNEKSLFESNFISEVKNGLRSKSESARHEFVSVLVEFLKSFKDIFKAYNDLCVLFDETDAEKDFYENIKHIQMHRRSRALKRLQKACNENQISANNLLGFMMPLVRSFLDDEAYHKYDYLIEEACGSIGAICYVLSWPKYLKTVEYYLKLLQKDILKQKLIIKILVNVLDAFHFDLSLSNLTDYYSERKNPNFKEIENEDESMEIDDELVNGHTSEEQKPDELNPEGAPSRRKKLVGSAMANKIHATLSKSIIPMLFKCLTKRLKSDDQHKINKRQDEDEQILRVPMALAILKLLNNLPSKTLETHLPGLLLKVCEMLKSRAISVRNTTRDCLMKMIAALPHKKYYYYVFKELSNSLTRGYQVHVLCYTIQIILKNIESKITVGDLDSSLGILMHSVNLELFSSVSEEKEVKQILAKTVEAKTTSSFNSLETLGKFVSQSRMFDLLRPFKEQLDACNSRKLLKKIEEALRRVLLGLLENTGLETENLMDLTYGLVNDTFTEMTKPKKIKKKFKNKKEDDEENIEIDESKKIELKSCLLIPSEPKRGGDKPKVQARTNQHVIVEFALQLMHQLMKKNRIVYSEQNTKFIDKLDPYLSKFVDYLDGKYLKVTIITLRCLSGLLKFPLPSLKELGKQIASKLFVLLRTYSGTSTSSNEVSNRGDNFELLMVCYKVISTLIRDVAHFNLNEEQLQVLMHYAERNLYDNHKQASAFNLLKSVLSRRLHCDELNDILGKVMKLSIQADLLSVRLQSRQTILQYMLEYALTQKKLGKILEFYIVQLNYEYENGRESALEMLATIFNTFPISQLNEYATMFYLPLAIQLHNDESPKCKKLAWLATKSLLEKVSIEKRDALFTITMALFKDQENPLHKRIAALLVKAFVEVETSQFERRFAQIIPVLADELDSNHFKQNLEENTSSLVNEKFYDQYLFNLLTLFMKILTECKLFQDLKYNKTINQIYDQVKIYLTHEHLWVQLISCQLFGLLFSNNTVEEFFKNKKSYLNYSTENVFLKLRDLIDSFCIQLKSPILTNEIAEQVVKNLAYMSKILNKYEYKAEDSADSLNHDINIEWLIKKVTKEAKYELVNKPKETIKRTHIFKWLAALALELGKDKLKDYLGVMISCLQREILVKETDENLKRLAQEVLDFIKQTIGTEEFSMIYSKSNKKRTEKIEDRKRKLAQTAVLDPQLAAMKKIRKMQRKKEAKKRKVDSKNPNKMFKAKKAKLISNEDNDY